MYPSWSQFSHFSLRLAVTGQASPMAHEAMRFPIARAKVGGGSLATLPSNQLANSFTRRGAASGPIGVPEELSRRGRSRRSS